MFLIAFACSVTTITAPNSFVCSDRTRVRLAAVRPIAAEEPPGMLFGKTLRCQGFDSRGAGHLIATCRFAGGRDVGCALVDKGVLSEVAAKQRKYRLPSCAQRAAFKA